MKNWRIDEFARRLAGRAPRRGILRGGAAALLSFGLERTAREKVAAQERGSGTIGVECDRCNCTGDTCDCCILGLTGGGVVRTESGDITFVLFATLVNDAPQEATGFVRWLDPNTEGGVNLESVGPIIYDWPEGEEHLRNVRGIMSVNGQDQQPFVLEVFDAGPELVGQDTARLVVGAAEEGASAGGFTYEAAGVIVGGDLQILDNVAPVTPPE